MKSTELQDLIFALPNFGLVAMGLGLLMLPLLLLRVAMFKELKLLNHKINMRI